MIAAIIWKGDILIADIEDLGKLDESEIYSRRLNAKKVLITTKMENLYFLWQMVQQNCKEETTNSKNPLRDGKKQKMKVQLYVPRDEPFPIPLKNTHVTRVNLYRFGRWTRKTN